SIACEAPSVDRMPLFLTAWDYAMGYHVSKARFAELVELALAELPPPIDEALDEVPVEILDRPTPQQLRSLKMKQNHLLLGLYVGRPRTKRSVEDPYRLPDRVFIFQDHIEQICRSEAELIEQVRKTVLHELGHHFGMDEDDLDELGYG